MTDKKELVAAYNHARIALRRDTGESIARILGVKSADDGELVGTGTFIRLRGKPYLITAEHVVARAQCYNGLVFASGEVCRPERFAYPFMLVSAPSDLAVVRVEEPQTGESRAVEASRFASDANTLHRDLLFLNGYPGAKSRSSGIAGGVVSMPVGIATVEGTCAPSWFNPAIHFALNYDPSEWEDENGNKATAPDPHGMSGSLVWRTKLAKPSEWSVARAQVIGVVTRWVPDDKVLVGTRIEAVRSFLLKALREEAAYFAWCNRGRPSGDSLTDWLCAEKAVKDL